MEPQRPPHQRFIRPPSYAAGPPAGDPRNNQAPPPRRSYGPSPPSSMPPGRSQPPYDPFRRAESEMQQPRPHPFNYPVSQHHTKPQSPVPFSPSYAETASAFHSRQSSHDSIKPHHDGGVKEYNTLYREGRMIPFLLLLLLCSSSAANILPSWSHRVNPGGELLQVALLHTHIVRRLRGWQIFHFKTTQIVHVRVTQKKRQYNLAAAPVDRWHDCSVLSVMELLELWGKTSTPQPGDMHQPHVAEMIASFFGKANCFKL